jgi:hypothetical protein
MTSRLSRPAAIGALCGFLTLTAGLAQADVTSENTITVEGVGAMAFGNMSGTTKTTISGDKSRTDSDIVMKSKIVRFLARGSVGPSATIVRLDQDRMYELNINKKEYTETTFEQLREQLQKLTDQSAQTDDKDSKKEPSAVDDSKCDWLPPTVDVKHTGEKQQIAGYDAERLTITATQPCKDKQTGSICEVALGLDEWLTNGFTESAEALKFHKAYAAKMGFDASSSQDFSQRAQQMFSRYKGIWTEIASKMQGVKGYPVKSSFTLGVGGEQCQSPNAKQAQSGDGSGSSGGSTPTSPKDLANQMAGKLGSLFHKKKDDSDTSAPPAPAAVPPPIPPADVALLTISSQLVSISTSAAAPDAFEVPADFKRVETKSH